MRLSEHISDEGLVSFLDGELDEQAFGKVKRHLADCSSCKERLTEFGRVSTQFSGLLENTPLPESFRLPASHGNVRRWAIPLAVAASTSIAVWLLPFASHVVTPKTPMITEPSSPAAAQEVIELDGERFVALPYSNPELPLDFSQVVEMQVPVNSLMVSDVGAGASEAGIEEDTVAAHVLIGIDGKPRGIHILNLE